MKIIYLLQQRNENMILCEERWDKIIIIITANFSISKRCVCIFSHLRIKHHGNYETGELSRFFFLLLFLRQNTEASSLVVVSWNKDYNNRQWFSFVIGGFYVNPCPPFPMGTSTFYYIIIIFFLQLVMLHVRFNITLAIIIYCVQWFLCKKKLLSIF